MSDKLRRQLIACVLGIMNGLLYSVVVIKATQLYSRYIVQRIVNAEEQFGITPVQISHNINWAITTCWFIGLFTIASCIGHRYWARRLKYPLLTWLAIGVAAVVGWNLLNLTLAWLDMWITGQPHFYRRVSSTTPPHLGPSSLALVILVNSIYGAAIQILTTQFTRWKMVRK